jgi:hypothetical protein
LRIVLGRGLRRLLACSGFCHGSGRTRCTHDPIDELLLTQVAEFGNLELFSDGLQLRKFFILQIVEVGHLEKPEVVRRIVKTKAISGMNISVLMLPQ